MTLVRLGYVAMSVHLENASPSKTMTYTRFSKLDDRDAAIRKLEQIAETNLHNCLRLFRHNLAHDIAFFRLSSKLVPLATHPDLKGWDYIQSVQSSLEEIQKFLTRNPNVRVDFHPDHFVLLNSPGPDVLKNSIKSLRMHFRLLEGMGVNPEHRCVLHVGGGYGDKEKALEQFIHNWAFVSPELQSMIILENDDKVFTLSDTLYLSEKLAVPMVFDYHHYLANHTETENWRENWERIVQTWKSSTVPVKMHISSPKSDKQFRAHSDYVDSAMFMDFLREIKGTVSQIDCMIEAKQKDDALFKLMDDIQKYPEIEIVDGGSFHIT
ncbi:UV DNA damage repair endonuclease UvsE [Virgibacillus litoralis]|uniref:UV DNA damage endonuclease n=1 Tax=Virgibacillus litoralis TaxID=578221 RepID=A0ABS4HG75_9BACI|nr:UV DNA damage repair endonuclease UvsE [Virgibacillus litoralis]MBP1949896.1 UV DNA damage endonuclease [Virgibacillus litoralis]